MVLLETSLQSGIAGACDVFGASEGATASALVIDPVWT